MPTSRYYSTLFLGCFVMSFFILILAYVLHNHGPRVRLVRFEDSATTSITKDSIITLSFDRPLNDADYTPNIHFTPQVPFSVRTSGQNILVTLEGNLKHQTKYTIVLDGVVTDRSGKRMRDPYIHQFTTSAPRYAYIERNYGLNPDDYSYADRDDHIKVATLGAEPESIFSHPQIRSFSTNNQYAVVVVKEEAEDALYTVNLSTHHVRREQLVFGGRIDNLTLSARGTIALFTVRPDYALVSQEYFEAFSNRVETLDVATGEIVSLKDAKDEPLKASGLLIDQNGQVALMQDPRQTFFAVSPFNDYEPVTLGSYSEAFSLDSDAGEIIFRDDSGFVHYDITEAKPRSLLLDTTGYITQISTQGGKFASSTAYSGGEFRSHIYEVTNWEDESSVVWHGEEGTGLGLRSFSPSYDGELLALHMNSDMCQYDNFGIDTECTEAKTIIYNIKDKETLKEFSGFGLVWLP